MDYSNLKLNLLHIPCFPCFFPSSWYKVLFIFHLFNPNSLITSWRISKPWSSRRRHKHLKKKRERYEWKNRNYASLLEIYSLIENCFISLTYFLEISPIQVFLPGKFIESFFGCKYFKKKKKKNGGVMTKWFKPQA